MSEPELEALAAEAAEIETAAVETPEPAPAEAGAAPPSADQAAALIGPLAVLVGNILCTRARVEPLTKAEAEALAEATARVAAFYLPAMSPVTEAWLNLAGVVGLIVVTRKPLPRPPAPAQAGGAPAAPEPVPGDQAAKGGEGPRPYDGA